MPENVTARREQQVIPTYIPKEPNAMPMFFEKKPYQGASGRLYPLPYSDGITDEKKDVSYEVYTLENEYIQTQVLPAIGGKILSGYDKIGHYDFIYRNRVIKPALVGLAGAWISGGIEFNRPQHHRPTTFLPLEASLEENPDGSKTLWTGEVDPFYRMKGMAGITVEPGRSYIKAKIRVYNRTNLPQIFMWWANLAVAVNESYRTIFPPDVEWVNDHDRRAVLQWPIAKGVYKSARPFDYGDGTDLSLYDSVKVPSSFLISQGQSDMDFVAGYDGGLQKGIATVADHHIAPGKKMWTWGHGDFGEMWCSNLTDEDGPYIELMTGVYTDNQPDFTWLQPYEEKSWKQYFMPYAEVGYVNNATKDALLNLEVKEGKGKVILYTTGVNKDVHIFVKDNVGGNTLFDKVISISPAEPFQAEFAAEGLKDEDILVEIRNHEGRILVSYQADKPEIKPVPDPAKAAKDPKDIASIEQLYLTGLHLEQYRHATYNPMDYYEEALRREPGDVRCNNAMGLLLMRKGQFAKAEGYFRKAVETLTERNPNPYDGEPYYNLGWSCLMQDKTDEAYDAFFKSAWNAAWQDAAYYNLAAIDCRRGNFEKALDLIDRSLVRNWHHHKARQLKASILRHLGRKEEALELIAESLKIDRFNMGCRFEQYLLTGDDHVLKEMQRLMHGAAHVYIEYALDFAQAGLYDEAINLLGGYAATQGEVYPMVHYALGYCHSRKGDTVKALEYYKKAEQDDHSYCFPNRIEEVLVLQDAMKENHEACAKAAYALGNFWYAARQYDNAIACWEASAAIDPAFPTVWRNLSLAYYNKRNDPQKAVETLEKAYRLDESDARILMELDQLYKRLGRPQAERLAFLEAHPAETESRDDLSIERITLYNQLGRYEEAEALIAARKFHPWEGGEGKITGQYTICHVELAKIALREHRYADALDLLQATDQYPYNLGEGKLINAEENDIWYYKGLAYRGLGDEENAKLWLHKATQGSAEPQQAFFYNDAQPDKIFYQGLAWRALGEEGKARGRFNKLIKHGEKHLFDHCRIDYFAVSLPDLAIWEDNLDKRNAIHCNYVMGLGYLGLEDRVHAIEYLDKARALDINHQGAQIHRELCE